MNLIPTRRGSGQRLNLPFPVGVELANTIRQLFAQTNSICVYGVNVPDIQYTGVVSLCKRGTHGVTTNEYVVHGSLSTLSRAQ